MIALDGHGPLYDQVFRAIRGSVLDGSFARGSRLPASRALARELGVSRIVVTLAYQQLYAEGYVRGRVGSGTFVSEELPAAPRRIPPAPGVSGRATKRAAPRWSRYGRAVLADRASGRAWWLGIESPAIDFQASAPDPAGFPTALWRRLTAARLRAARTDDFGYGDPAGLPALRAALARHLATHRGIEVDTGQIVILNGSQHGLDLTARLLVDPGDEVVIEEPHFHGARQAFQLAGAHLLPVPVDDNGLVVAALPAPSRRPRLVYVTPSHQYPLGVSLSAARRLALLEWAERSDAWIVEDDYDSELRYDSHPLQAIRGLAPDGRVIYLGTFSKLVFPALRIGFAVLPPEMALAYSSARWLSDRHGSMLEQGVLADFLDGGHFDRHLRRARVRYAERRRMLIEAVREHLGDDAAITGARGGMHLVLELRGARPAQIEELADRACRRGVGVYPLAPFHLGRVRRAGLLLGYAALDAASIREGIRTLAGAWRSLRSR